MRCLALDIGEERIGVAISDEGGFLARPLEIIARKAGPSSFRRIAEVVAEFHVGVMVVGLPLLPDGSEGKQVRSTRAYLRGLARHVEVPVVLWDERSSTQQARAILSGAEGSVDLGDERRFRGPGKRRRRDDDAVAAAVILQEYLNAQSELGGRSSDEGQSGGQNP